MKKNLCIFSIGILFSQSLIAQNTFPSSGNVGIGTTTPTATLEIIGQLRTSNSGTGSANIDLKNNNGLWHISGPRSYETNNPLSIFWSNSGNYYRHMTILDNGRVGIGTANPVAPLHLFVAVPPTHPGVNSRFIKLETNFYAWEVGINGGNFQISNSSGFKFSVENTRTITVGDAIVLGKISCKEIKVTSTGWPDFVFNDGYKLKTLEEIEQFIKANKHLPGIPSEKEVLTNGVNIGEMNALLLQKIEEMTLLMIELKKETLNEIQVLKEDNERLKKIIEK